MATSGQSQKRTTKHDVIKQWAEARGGVPALVRTTQEGLRIKIGHDEPSYEPITWEKWFALFDEHGMAFVYEDPGYANKVVRRNEHDEPVST